MKLRLVQSLPGRNLTRVDFFAPACGAWRTIFRFLENGFGTVEERYKLAWVNQKNSRCLRVVIRLVLLASIGCKRAKSKDEWMAAFLGEPMPGETSSHEFGLFGLEQQTHHLIGTWMYVNYDIRGREVGPVIIEGGRTRNGLFWPDVRLQVKDDSTGKWKTISNSSNHWWEVWKKREKVTIARNSQNLELMVNLDEFQPLIGKYEVGRIVLNSGEVSEFELKSLLLPAELLEEPKRTQRNKRSGVNQTLTLL